MVNYINVDGTMFHKPELKEVKQNWGHRCPTPLNTVAKPKESEQK